MATNFLNLWLLARVLQTAVAAALCVAGGILGFQVARRWRPGQSSEAQLALERQAELAASVLQVALLLEILGLGLAVFVADHLVGSIRGAMCAFGVLASAPMGFPSLLASALTALVCGWWVVLHRFDLRLEAPVLTRRKFLALLPVAAFAVADLGLALAFAWQLDFKVIASCCSVWVDAAVVQHHAGARLLAPGPAAVLGLAAVVVAGGVSARTWRRPTRGAALGAGAGSAVASVAVWPAILTVVAPHILGTPTHLCPFCLLHAQGGGLGWPLFGALLLASINGAGLGLIELQRPAVAEPASLEAMERTLGGWAALAWLAVLVCGAVPVARYWLQAGGVTVFGKV